jgi:hypothetical protein
MIIILNQILEVFLYLIKTQTVNELLKYAKELTCEAKLLDEEAVKCLNVDNDAPVVLQLTDSEIVDIVPHPDRGDDNNNEVLN